MPLGPKRMFSISGRFVGIAGVAGIALLTFGYVRASASGALLQRQDSSLPAAASPQRAMLDRYCVTCHSDIQEKLPSLQTVDTSNVAADAEIFEKVVRKLRAGLMPPAGRPRPDRSTLDSFTSWLETNLDRAAAARLNPGRTEPLHRLNRAEYQNVVRDLVALEVDVTSLLPSDDASYGFDNMASVLQVNQSLMESYLSAARVISRAAIGSAVPTPTAEEFPVPVDFPQDQHVAGLPFGTRGGTLIRHNFPLDAQYVIKVDLACGPPVGDPLGKCDAGAGFADLHQLEITVDGERVELFTLEPRNEIKADAVWQVRIPVKAGPREIGVAFLKLPSVDEVDGLRPRFMKPYYQNNNGLSRLQAIYQPAVVRVTITGPIDGTGATDTPSRHRIFVCRPTNAAQETGCAKTIVSTLARRAYRRPVTDADLQGLFTFYNAGRSEGGFEAGIERALRALLVSPEFLFRAESDPAGIAPNTNYRVSDLELASRLSFFLWSSIPDDELLDVAERGRLKEPAVFERQVRRMVADPRSEALVSNFLGQWLQLRNLERKRPAEALFPNFDGSLRQAFRRETELLFQDLLRQDRPILELLTANYTFVNERLALHYGIPNVRGSHFRRVTFGADNQRRGLLGHGSVLLVTSHAIRTSPVLRGKWILQNILGVQPPAPPAFVPPFNEAQGGAKARALSVRDRMIEHRRNPVCAACHAMIDPAGFALENFDAVGRWRTHDEFYNPIEPSGALPDGTEFDGLTQFREALVSRPERFVTTITERLLTYALGRGLEYYDAPAVRRIMREAAGENYRLSALILGIAKSPPFQMRRSPAPILSASQR